MKKTSEYKELTLLGSVIEKYPQEPSKEILETFPNKYPDNEFLIEFNQEGEFTSICPVTGQPDFADILIKYIPHKHLIEAKSLKIYLMSYRNKKDFGEFITNNIMEDLWAVCKPKWIEVTGSFKPRGGISWKTLASKGKRV
jgi:7-cyano-7-deazaguanine reductase